jgi:hypothetical protein
MKINGELTSRADNGSGIFSKTSQLVTKPGVSCMILNTNSSCESYLNTMSNKVPAVSLNREDDAAYIF